jgi:hypothetical protein
VAEIKRNRTLTTHAICKTIAGRKCIWRGA